MTNHGTFANLSRLLGVNLSKITDAFSSRQSSTSGTVTIVVLFGTGLLMGAGLALLFAPQSGEEMLRDIGERISSRGRSPNVACMGTTSASAEI